MRASACAQAFARIVDRLQALAALEIRMHHAALDRPRAHDRHLDHQVVEAARPQPRQHAHLGPALDLEHTDRVGGADHVVGGRVFGRDVLHLEGVAALRADQVQAAPDRAEHAQCQHVDLEQAHGVEVVLLPLDHRAVRHGRVLHRHQAREFALRQHEAADMLAQMARKAEQLLRQIQPQLDARIVGRQAGGVQRIEQGLLQPHHAIEPAVLLGKGIDQRLGNTQRLADIADRTLGPVGHDHAGDGGALAAVFGVDVLDHLLAPLVFEVDVDVGRLVALAADETLEQHVHARRIDLGHAQAITDRRIRRRAASLTQDVAFARKAHDVVHGEEIHLVFQFGDELEFVFDLCLHLRRNTVWVALAHALVGELAQRLRRSQAGQTPSQADTGNAVRPG